LTGANGAGSELSSVASDSGLDSSQLHYVTAYSLMELQTFHCDRLPGVESCGANARIVRSRSVQHSQLATAHERQKRCQHTVGSASMPCVSNTKRHGVVSRNAMSRRQGSATAEAVPIPSPCTIAASHTARQWWTRRTLSCGIEQSTSSISGSVTCAPIVNSVMPTRGQRCTGARIGCRG